MKSLAEYVTALKNGFRHTRSKPTSLAKHPGRAWRPHLKRSDRTDFAAAEASLKRQGWAVTRKVTDSDEGDVARREETLQGSRSGEAGHESLRGTATTREGPHFSEHCTTETYTYERRPREPKQDAAPEGEAKPPETPKASAA